MRSHCKPVLAVLLGALALVAVSSSAAFATTSWKIEGKELKAGETAALSEAATLNANIVLGQALGWKVECSSAKSVAANLEGPNLYAASALRLEGCKMGGTKADKEKCSVATAISTNPVQGTLTAGTVPVLTIKPTNAEELLTTLTISGTCSAAGKPKIKGTIGGEFSASGEAVTQPLSFTATSGSKLSSGEEALVFTGQLGLTLASGKQWAA